MKHLSGKWLEFSQLARLFERFPGGDREQKLEYERLFRGTSGDVYIPLWASLCRSEKGIFKDETTLEVIREYHAWGYVPVQMEGNPPDYIGEQFRFLAYLCACALHGEREKYEREIENFISLFTLDTAVSVAEGIRNYTDTPYYLTLAERILKVVCSDEEEPVVPENEETNLLCFENYRNGPAPVIRDEALRVVMTGGSNNCGGKCSIRTEVQDDCLTRLETGCGIGDPALRACVRGRSYRQTYLSGKRLRYPMKRIGERGEGKFERISWEEALDTIATEWVRIRDTYGVGSRYVNYGLGINAAMRPDLMAKRLLAVDGGFLNFYGSYSFACAQFITPYIYGDAFSGNSIEDLVNTKYLLLWGHNPSETIYSPQGNYLIAQAKEKGAKVVVIDPRRSDTVLSIADEWVPIRPSTDAALCAAMAYVIWSEGLQDQHFMDTYCQGFDEEHMPEGVDKKQNYRAYLFGELDGVAKTPEWGEEITGVPAETIRHIAVEYATAKPACLFPGLGNQRTANGEQNVRAMAALCCLTGNVGVPGGSAAGFGMAKEERRPLFPVGNNPYPGSISCFLWTEAIKRGHELTALDDGVQGMDQLESDIKMMFNLGSNTLINQHADINNSIRILKDPAKCELIVCSDIFMTPSAKFADILLPATCFLEHNNMAGPWRNGHYLLSNNKVLEPMFECRAEYDWLSDLAKRLGIWDAWSEGRETQEEWLEHIYAGLKDEYPEMPAYEQFRRDGGYTYQNPHIRVAYEEQIQDPAHVPFATPSGKIEIFSRRIYELPKKNIPPIPSYVPAAEGYEDSGKEKYPLQLIGWHTKRRCHTIHDNNPWMEEVEPQRMWINPQDAKERGIEDESIAEVFNDRGRIRIPVRVTERVMAGVVAISEGAWYTPGPDGIDRRGSINVLTSTRPTPFARGNGQHTNLVEVTRAL